MLRLWSVLILLMLPMSSALGENPVVDGSAAEEDRNLALSTMRARHTKMQTGAFITGQRSDTDNFELEMETPFVIDGDPIFSRWVFSVDEVQRVALNLGNEAVESQLIEVRSIGGKMPRKGNMSQVTAVLLRSGKPVCSATAISRKHFLTAAHCFCGPEKPVEIAFGRNTSDAPFTRVFSSNFELVESAKDMDCRNYSTMKRTLAGSDFAVVELSSEVGELYLKSPAALPNAADIAGLSSGQTAIVVGFGRRSNNPRSRKFRIGVKNYVFAPLVDVDCDGGRYDCVKGNEVVSRDARRGRSGPCNGDSGGAMFAKVDRASGSEYVLVGVVSRMARSDLRCGDAVAFSLLSPSNLSEIAALVSN